MVCLSHESMNQTEELPFRTKLWLGGLTTFCLLAFPYGIWRIILNTYNLLFL